MIKLMNTKSLNFINDLYVGYNRMSSSKPVPQIIDLNEHMLTIIGVYNRETNIVFNRKYTVRQHE